MWNRDYEAEKAKYVDSMIFRIMELETENELLKERMNSDRPAAQNNNVNNASSNTNNNVRHVEEELRGKLNEANLKYRKVTQQYAELKAAYDAANPKVSGLRKIAKWYANYGIIGIFRKIGGKLKGSQGA